MAKKSTNTEETKQSTVVLNDEVKANPIQDPVENTEDTPTGDCSNPDHVCTCKPGHCPNKDCKSGHYWTEGTESDQYLYHYDSEDETIKLEELRQKKWKFAGHDIGSWIVMGGIEVAAALTGTPSWGIGLFAANQILDAPKLKEIPEIYREISAESEAIKKSPVGLLFKASNNNFSAHDKKIIPTRFS